MILKKNKADQKIAIYAWDDGAGAPKTGDAANITARISKDGGASAALTNSFTELDATNMKGVYVVTLTQGETDADLILISAVSSTANVVIRPVFISTVTSLYLWKRTA